MSISWNTRVATSADEQVLRDITREAFGRQYEVDYLDALRNEPKAWLPDLACVATADERPIAYALLTLADVGSTPVLSLGPVAVMPEHQRQGAGDAAVRAVLALGLERAEPAVVVLGHDTYYPRFGFRQATEFGIRHPQYDGPNLMALALGDRAVPAGPLSYPVEG
ncbi:N-acetyltransferase [Kribbella albertanoniae]|uniref:N-acetyltransferase n=1 Tax=Kribbella albertanoniae TaxID=1266829 RepID=A0A4R4PP40_9ACTN|nr:N-acetyltransferase [Kribbella albertanoniae]TDC23990.1 N-acetyltransferase [Kribbella albertanoniae]